MYYIINTEVFSFSICLHMGTKLRSVHVILHRFEILFILVIIVGGFLRTKCVIGGQDFGANGWQFVFARRKPPPTPRHLPWKEKRWERKIKLPRSHQGQPGVLLRYPNDIDRSLNEAAADKYGNIALTIITTPLRQYPLYRWSLVPLGGYIVNSLDCYCYRLIGKLTDFLDLQEFSFRDRTVDSSTSAAQLFLHSFWEKSAAPCPRLQVYVCAVWYYI